MKIVLDTNILCQDYFLKSLQAQLLLENHKVINGNLCIPQVVVDETINRYKEDLQEAVEKATKTNRVLQKLLGSDENIDIDIENKVAVMSTELMKKLNQHKVDILPYPKVSHEEIVSRDLSRKKPFQRDGKGYRDTLIWENIKSLYGWGIDDLVFISNNPKDFGGGPSFDPELESEIKSPKRLKIVRSLKEFNDIYLAPNLAPIVSAEKYLGKTSLGKFNLKSWLTVELPHAVLYEDFNFPLAGFPDSLGSAYITKILSFKEISIKEIRDLEDNLLLRINTIIEADCSASTDFEDYCSSSEIREFFGDDENEPFYDMSTTFEQSVEFNFDIILDKSTFKVETSEMTYICSDYGDIDWGTYYI